jgi:hypothetical protein
MKNIYIKLYITDACYVYKAISQMKSPVLLLHRIHAKVEKIEQVNVSFH